MSATNKIWVNGVPPTCEDVDLNGFKNENNNLIVGSGQSLSTSDNQQTHKAVAHYAAAGDYYVDSGTASTYVLSPTGSQIAPAAYATGMRIRFRPVNTGGASSTVNVAGLGVKNILDFHGNALVPLAILTGNLIEASYDGTGFRLSVESFLGAATAPTVFGGTTAGSPTYASRVMTATVTNNLCRINIDVTLSSKGGMAGTVNIGGLPSGLVAAAGITDTCLVLPTAGLTSGDCLYTTLPTATSFELAYADHTTDSALTPLDASNITDSSIIRLSTTIPIRFV